MKKYLVIFILFAYPAFAQTTTNTTNNTTTTTTGTTNATVSSPGNVVVSNPNATVGNQVNSPANSNNVYVITPNTNNNSNGSGDNDRNRRYGSRYDEQREYDRAQGQHDYRDRANYYNIRRNQAIEAQGGASSLSQRHHQSDMHSRYPDYFRNNNNRHGRD